MRTTTIKCDRCRQRIEAPSAVATLQGVGTLKNLAADLCQPCASALRGWLDGDDQGRPPEPSGLLADPEPFHSHGSD